MIGLLSGTGAPFSSQKLSQSNLASLILYASGSFRLITDKGYWLLRRNALQYWYHLN